MRLWRSQRVALGQLPHLGDRDQLLGPGRRRHEVAERRRAREHLQPDAADLAREPLLERALRVDGDRPQVLGQLDLGLRHHALTAQRARHAILLGDLADDGPAARGGGRQTERRRPPWSCRRPPCRSRRAAAGRAGVLPSWVTRMTMGVHGPEDQRGVRVVPAAAAAARPDVLLGHAPAAGRRAPGHARAVRVRPHRRPDRRRAAPPADPRRAPGGARRVGGGAARRPVLAPGGDRPDGRRRAP